MIEYIDSQEIVNISNDINLIMEDYFKNVDNFYNLIEEMPLSSKEWIGNAAERYCSIVLTEKNQMIKYGNELIALNDYIKQIALKTEDVIDINNVEERNIL